MLVTGVVADFDFHPCTRVSDHRLQQRRRRRCCRHCEIYGVCWFSSLMTKVMLEGDPDSANSRVRARRESEKDLARNINMRTLNFFSEPFARKSSNQLSRLSSFPLSYETRAHQPTQQSITLLLYLQETMAWVLYISTRNRRGVSDSKQLWFSPRFSTDRIVSCPTLTLPRPSWRSTFWPWSWQWILSSTSKKK